MSNALVVFSFLNYGAEIATLLSLFESITASYLMRRNGLPLSTKTMYFNVLMTVVTIGGGAFLVTRVFSSPEAVLAGGDPTSVLFLVGLIGLVFFLLNSILVAVAVSFKQKKSVWEIWNESCFSTLVVFLSEAVVAGLAAKALHQVNIALFAFVIAFFTVVYITYRRYIDDIRDNSAKAEASERKRAEQAEEYVSQLQHYVEELENSSKALRESREKFRHAAFHDELTGLPNRNHFIDSLKFLIEKNQFNSTSEFAVLFLDLNRFKTINDSLGHSMGDRLITNVSKRLSNLVKEGDLVGRFSGDEFGILVHNPESTEKVVEFAEEIVRKLSEPFTVNGRQIFTSVSIGIALGNLKYTEAEDLLRDADIAMYYAKENHKNYVIFDRNMHTRAVTLMQLETDLRYAIEREELELHYQPIIGLDEIKIVGFEALVRWNHPRRGMIPPNEFITVSEDTGLIIPMTLMILRNACNQVVEWQKGDLMLNDLFVSVNLSVKHLVSGDLVEQIERILRETRIKPHCLKLEITENGIMENADLAIEVLAAIRKLGVQISIDDFGTGYSSLSYLHKFPIDTLKVDRSFVTTMESGSENGEIVRTIIALAKALKLSVVAEGIESIHQFHQLHILGCEYGQGYLFSRPLPVSEMTKLLERRDNWEKIMPTANFEIMIDKTTDFNGDDILTLPN